MPEPIVTCLMFAVPSAVLAALVGGWAGRVSGRRRRALEGARSIRHEAERLRSQAAAEKQATLRDAGISAREGALAHRLEAEAGFRARASELSDREATLAARDVRSAAEGEALQESWTKLSGREAPIIARDEEVSAYRAQINELEGAFRVDLERAAGQKAEALRQALAETEIEQVRARVAQQLRQIGESVADPEHVRGAKRIMSISIGRYYGHYLTERHLSTISLGEPRHGRPAIAAPDLCAIEAVAGIKLTLSETLDAVRIEGLDGVGREVARRCMAKLLRRPMLRGEAVGRLAKEIVGEVDREIMALGRRAFTALEIERAHPEIVNLVGRLNYRTSYTQNQWKHAVEAAFLCGMMADELGLDRKLARRAALLHDIGKALTHELDGSHAVIGADYARRLGEVEVVANAIGAHHTDEPFGSPYAYLVAAADAMSGARPGARRQMEDSHVAKLADLERLSRGFSGVGEAFAVQGGREVRVYVQQDRVDDLGAVKLSSEIAETISREMTFPGQIRVTVIREFKAVDTAS